MLNLPHRGLNSHHWGLDPPGSRGWASTIVLVPLCNKGQQFATFEPQLIGNWQYMDHQYRWIFYPDEPYRNILSSTLPPLFFSLSSTEYPDCTYKTWWWPLWMCDPGTDLEKSPKCRIPSHGDPVRILCCWQEHHDHRSSWKADRGSEPRDCLCNLAVQEVPGQLHWAVAATAVFFPWAFLPLWI